MDLTTKCFLKMASGSNYCREGGKEWVGYLLRLSTEPLCLPHY